jgi:hypothetical protein
MPTYSALPMYAYDGADPHIDLENPRFVVHVEWTWPEGDWSHFSIVRSTRSPARRREEGQVMMEISGREWDHETIERRLPVYRDPQPPPGEWTYYTAFVLNPDRVWVNAGSVFEVGIANYDWSLRLPESLPGVAISEAQQTVAPAEQSHDLVQFLQNPGAFLDRVVTMAEATQYFWDPERVPPQLLQAMTESIGYPYDDSFGIGRGRDTLRALMGPQQGSVQFIENFTKGVMGTDTRVVMSNNHMLDANDSSFEGGDITETHWEPTTGLELRKYENWLSPIPTLHPNVMREWYLHIDTGKTLLCGEADPISFGVPVSGWTEARMSCYAHDEAAPTVTLSMGLKLYDQTGSFLRDVEILPSQTLTSQWSWYGNADDSAVDLGEPGFAYAVPYLTVSNACSVDLIVVDDG